MHTSFIRASPLRQGGRRRMLWRPLAGAGDSWVCERLPKGAHTHTGQGTHDSDGRPRAYIPEQRKNSSRSASRLSSSCTAFSYTRLTVPMRFLRPEACRCRVDACRFRVGPGFLRRPGSMVRKTWDQFKSARLCWVRSPGSVWTASVLCVCGRIQRFASTSRK